MLAGVGGRTIEEAKANLSYVEAQQWFAYMREHGPLSTTLALKSVLELGFAMVSMVVNNSQGGKARIEDFMPKKTEEVVEDDGAGVPIENVLAMLQAVARGNRGKK